MQYKTTLCDEQKPSCRNCIKHGAECDFVAALASFISGGGSGSEGRQGPESTAPQRTPGLNFLDLELLHNFTTSTYATLSTDVNIQNFYRLNIVRLGLHCDYLMRAILAVSSLHLAHYSTDRKEYYVSQALLYHQLASRQAMNLMSCPNKENGVNLFVFSIMTLYFALGSPRKSGGDMLLTGESSFPDWLFLPRGTRTLSQLLDDDRDNGPLGPLFLHGRKRRMAMYDNDGHISGFNHPRSNLFQEHVRAERDKVAEMGNNTPGRLQPDGGGHTPHLQAQPSPCASTAAPSPSSVVSDTCRQNNKSTTTSMSAPFTKPDPPSPTSDHQFYLTNLENRINAQVKDKTLRDIYAYTISELRPTLDVFFPIAGQEIQGFGHFDITDAFVWIFTVSDIFMPLLQEPNQKQEAVAIFMFFSTCLLKVTQHWWLQGWGEHLIQMSWHMLDAIKPQNLAENQYQNHTNIQPRLLRASPDPGIAHHTDSQSGSEAAEPHGEAGTHEEDALVQRHLLGQLPRDDDPRDEAVDGEDLGEDGGNEVGHEAVGAEDADLEDCGGGARGPVGGAEDGEEDGEDRAEGAEHGGPRGAVVGAGVWVSWSGLWLMGREEVWIDGWEMIDAGCGPALLPSSWVDQVPVHILHQDIAKELLGHLGPSDGFLKPMRRVTVLLGTGTV
ncbi:hypothetical protein MKZ38_000474 [Zalerion maritima]|uniref:Zn(2)-C6 fungal-type domain-containing protein n=1 Tax=Zalerion maritima TaxID=339359 RepID=A0AAD5RF59_9PEZI|nr:hypothetical protein MKZ38_000474 [Zalerion maritima]